MFAPDVKNRQVAVMFMTDFYLLLNRNFQRCPPQFCIRFVAARFRHAGKLQRCKSDDNLLPEFRDSSTLLEYTSTCTKVVSSAGEQKVSP
jgi:hypothetical protein